MARELAFAGEIQTSFMARKAPNLPGWEISTSLLPAMETSGDFLDIRILSDGNLGFLVADVVEKGVGAALFMTLSWSLLRIFSDEYPAVPQRVFSEVNDHILDGTSTNQFLTIFYGVMNPGNGRLVYCNAGHPPPIFVKSGNIQEPARLIRTGMPLAVEVGESWNHGFVQFEVGDLLFLYTDGIIEAQNQSDALYGINRLEKVLVRSQGKSVGEVNQFVLRDVKRFQGPKTQLDDIAIISIKKEIQP
jgi:sigma-B regulation protein RsbU (phosphoserine phosphatase)